MLMAYNCCSLARRSAMSVRLTASLVGVAGVIFLLNASTALAKDRADCDRSYQPKFGQRGKDVSWEPTGSSVAAAMLQLAKTTSRDRVYDLGAGDGAIVIVAAKQFGATAIGVEYDPALARLAQCYIEAAGVADKAKVIEGDVFKTDFSSATVVTLFMTDSVDVALRPTILNMTPGTRIISHNHKMAEWKWDGEVQREGEKAYLWIVPAKVQGTWEFKESKGSDSFTLALQQRFQMLTGSAQVNGKQSSLTGSLSGSDISIDLGGQRKLTGKIDNKEISATVSDGRSARQYVGREAKR